MVSLEDTKSFDSANESHLKSSSMSSSARASPRPSPPRLILDRRDEPPISAWPSSPEQTSDITLMVQPASPAPSSPRSFKTISTSSSQPASPNSHSAFTPPSPKSPVNSLAARRKAKKQLSLVVPGGPAQGPANLLSPSSLSFGKTQNSSTVGLAEDDSETRSLPPSPISLQAFIGPEGREQNDRTIGRLMMKQQAEEMRVQMKGGRNMKRRTSIPRLSLSSGPVSAGATPTDGPASLVQTLRRDMSERADSALDDDVEEFPYAHGPREILPGIYLGSEQNARDPAVLRRWNINYVLNVAKEVECPWIDDVIVEDNSDEIETLAANSIGRPNSRSPALQMERADADTDAGAALEQVIFIRPTASTPNLHAVYSSSPTSPSTAPSPVPPLPRQHSDGAEYEITPRDLPRSRRSSPKSQRGKKQPSGGAVRFSANSKTGRPSLAYLWLKWGHDESDLVEALKFQSAFDFLDEARSSGDGTGRVLVHCQCGVSRSATVVIAYCMREAARALEEGRELTSDLRGCTGMHDTYSFVKEKSEWVGPNLGLVFQLVAYERTLRGASGEMDDDAETEDRFPPAQDSREDDRRSTRPHSSSIGSAPPMANSPRTPIWSEGSSASDSHLSTPEVDNVMLGHPSLLGGKSRIVPNLSVLVPNASLRVSDNEPVHLSPTRFTQGLNLHDTYNEQDLSSETTVGTFVLPTPPARQRSMHLSPDMPDVLHEDVVSPTTSTFRRTGFAPTQLSIDTLKASDIANVSLTDKQSTPKPSTASSGSGQSSSTTTQRIPSPMLSSNGRASPQAKPFGASQTPKERRASHRRVFSDTLSMPAFLKGRSTPPPPPPPPKD